MAEKGKSDHIQYFKDVNQWNHHGPSDAYLEMVLYGTYRERHRDIQKRNIWGNIENWEQSVQIKIYLWLSTSVSLNTILNKDTCSEGIYIV